MRSFQPNGITELAGYFGMFLYVLRKRPNYALKINHLGPGIIKPLNNFEAIEQEKATKLAVGSEMTRSI